MNGRNLLLSAARGLGYLVFFCLATLMFVGLTFPEEQAKGFLSAHGARALKGKVEIGAMDVSVLFGSAELEDVALKLPAPVPKGPPGAVPVSGKPRPDSVISVSRLAVDLALLPLLFDGERMATFEGEIQGGEFTGGEAVMSQEGEMDLRVEKLENIRLGSGKLVQRAAGYDLRGTLSGSLDVHRGLSLEDLRATVELNLAEAQIIKPTVPTRQLGPIQLSDIDLGDMHLLVRADTVSELGLSKRGAGGRSKDGTVIQLAEFTATGGDVELQFDDQSVIRIVPNAPFSQARLDVHFAVKIHDRFFDKTLSDDDGEISQPNKILRMALKQDSRLRAATRDGVLGMGCRGTVGKPDCRPETSRVRGGFKKRRVSFAPSDEEEEEDDKAKANASKRDKMKKTREERQRASQKRREEARKKREEAKRLGIESRDESAARNGRSSTRSTARKPPPSPSRGSSSVRPPPVTPKSARAPAATMRPRLLSPSPLGGSAGTRDSAYGGSGEEEEEEEDEEEEDEDEDEEEEDEDEDDEEEDEDEDDEDEDEEEDEDED